MGILSEKTKPLPDINQVGALVLISYNQISLEKEGNLLKR